MILFFEQQLVNTADGDSARCGLVTFALGDHVPELLWAWNANSIPFTNRFVPCRA